MMKGPRLRRRSSGAGRGEGVAAAGRTRTLILTPRLAPFQGRAAQCVHRWPRAHVPGAHMRAAAGAAALPRSPVGPRPAPRVAASRWTIPPPQHRRPPPCVCGAGTAPLPARCPLLVRTRACSRPTGLRPPRALPGLSQRKTVGASPPAPSQTGPPHSPYCLFWCPSVKAVDLAARAARIRSHTGASGGRSAAASPCRRRPCQ